DDAQRHRQTWLDVGFDYALRLTSKTVAQSTFAPVAFTTCSYLANSAFMKAPNCSGVVGTGSAKRAAKRACVSGALSAATKAWFSLSRVAVGVPAGATRPHQVSIEKPLSVSATGGASGRKGLRCSVVTANALSLPALMLGAAVARLSKLKSTCPDSSASCAGLPPL